MEGVQPVLIFSALAVALALLGFIAVTRKANREEGALAAKCDAEIKRIEGDFASEIKRIEVRIETVSAANAAALALAATTSAAAAAVAAASAAAHALANERQKSTLLEAEVARLRSAPPHESRG